jgi:hypothetical protein
MGRTFRRLAQAGLGVLLVLPGVAAAAAVNAQIRIEGGTTTLLPPTVVPTDTTTVPLKDGTNRVVQGPTLLGQLVRAAEAFQLPLRLSFSTLGGQDFVAVERIGPDDQGQNFEGPSFWLYKVNHKSTDAANVVNLNEGDSSLFYFTSDTQALELDLAVSADTLADGARLDVTVMDYDGAGTPTPAAGAVVRYGDQLTSADAQGHASFAVTGQGPMAVSATRGTDIRSPVRTVCGYGADPTICSLPAPAAPGARPAPPPAATGAGGVSAATDTTPPGSRVMFPVAGRRYRRVLGLRGIAGPDRSDVAGVQVAIAQRVGTLCRFLGADGRFAAPGPCAAQRYRPARSVGGNWLLVLGRGLRPGTYRVWSRAIDGAGNRESVGIAGVNTLQFTVAAARRPHR